MAAPVVPPPPRPRRTRRRSGWLGWVTAVAVLAVVVVGAQWLAGSVQVLPFTQQCVALASGRSVEVTPEQAQNAATIAAVAERRGLPARAVTIALATAYQESKLRNIDYGHLDSLGLFQQRPSQGWGSSEQVRDPAYAANAFYDALVKVPGYTELPVTEAAQAVQRSAYPTAYADHEADARVLASALTGWSRGALSCTIRHSALPAEQPGESGFTPRAQRVADDVRSWFGEDTPVTTYQTSGGDSTHDRGLALDIFVPMQDGAGSREGWATAHWLVANAERLGVATVIYDDRIWSAHRGREGWREYTHPSGSTTVTDRHLDHIHVDVVEAA